MPRKSTIPPHILWPMMIIGLLCMSITAAVGTAILAQSDGGPQVVEDYYQKAVDWDAAQARQQASDALGWQATVHIGVLDQQDARLIEIIVLDREGVPVENLAGVVRASRPHRANRSVEAVLQAEENQPGTYRQALSIGETGLWDIAITATRDGQSFQTVVRKDVQP